jgi:hypothetical protein
MRVRSVIVALAVGCTSAAVLSAAPSALADDPGARVITLAGDLQSELGCPATGSPLVRSPS